MSYYKATRPDGTDFLTGTIDYAAALVSGEVITHPSKRTPHDPSTYLSVSVEPADCTGFSWPCRLFRVEPVGRAYRNPTYPHKREVKALRVVEELPAHMALGPNGEAMAAFIERCRTLMPEQARELAAAWDAARDAVWAAARAAGWDAGWDAARARDAGWDAARDAGWAAARAAAWAAARDAGWAAAWAIVARDLITVEQFDILTQPFVDAGLGDWV